VCAQADGEVKHRIIVLNRGRGAPFLVEEDSLPEVVNTDLVLALKGLHELGNCRPKGNVRGAQVVEAFLGVYRLDFPFVEKYRTLPRFDY